MVIEPEIVPAGFPKRPVFRRDEEARRLANSLARSSATEGIGEHVMDASEEVLGQPVPSAGCESGGRVDGVPIRLGLPMPWWRSAPVVPAPSLENVERVLGNFRGATRLLIQAAPYRTETYPTAELRLLISLRDEDPAPADIAPHLRRYALASLALLDLMGDDEE